MVVLPDEIYEKYVDPNTGEWLPGTPDEVIRMHEECMMRQEELAEKGIYVS